MKRTSALLVAAAAAVLALGACSADPPSSDLVRSSSPASASASASSHPSSSAPSSTAPSSTPPPPPVETTTTAPADNGIPDGWDKDGNGQIDPDAPIGDRGCDTTQCLLDQIEQGAREAGQCSDGAVVNEGGGNYSTCQNGVWSYVAPTFDPGSGDGYGPNQPLPPLCVRFPQDYQC